MIGGPPGPTGRGNRPPAAVDDAAFGKCGSMGRLPVASDRHSRRGASNTPGSGASTCGGRSLSSLDVPPAGPEPSGLASPGSLMGSASGAGAGLPGVDRRPPDVFGPTRRGRTGDSPVWDPLVSPADSGPVRDAGERRTGVAKPPRSGAECKAAGPAIPITRIKNTR